MDVNTCIIGLFLTECFYGEKSMEVGLLSRIIYLSVKNVKSSLDYRGFHCIIHYSNGCSLQEASEIGK